MTVKLPPEDSETLEGLMSWFPEIPAHLAEQLHEDGITLCAGHLAFPCGWLVPASIVRTIFLAGQEDLPKLIYSLQNLIANSDWDCISSPSGDEDEYCNDTLVPLIAMRLESGL